MKFVYLVPFLLLSQLFADVSSNSGSIKFKPDLSSGTEMTLNSTGLGIHTSPSANIHVLGNAIISKQLFIGDGGANSKLKIDGSLEFQTQTLSSNTTLSETTVILAGSASDNITVTLPYAGNVTGRLYKVKNTQTFNHLNIDSINSTIDDQLSLLVGGRSYVELLSSDNVWHVMSSHGTVYFQGILDHVSGATAAYGLRLLRNDYSGPCLKVRRSSDNTTQNIYTNSNGTVNTNAISIWAGGTDVFVETWYDQTGNGNDLVQATEDNQPQLILSGETKISFDGTNDSMEDAFTLNQPFTLISFNQIGSSAQTSNDIFIDGYNGDSIDFRYKSSTIADTYNGSYVTQSYPISADERLLYSFNSNGASSEVWKNGNSHESGAGGGSNAAGIALGYRRPSNNRWGEFSIMDLIIYPTTLSSSDRVRVEENINNFWQIY